MRAARGSVPPRNSLATDPGAGRPQVRAGGTRISGSLHVRGETVARRRRRGRRVACGACPAHARAVGRCYRPECSSSLRDELADESACRTSSMPREAAGYTSPSALRARMAGRVTGRPSPQMVESLLSVRRSSKRRRPSAPRSARLTSSPRCGPMRTKAGGDVMRDVRSERRATTLSQHRIGALAIAGLAALVFSTALVASSSATGRAAPQRGGTLRLLGTGDIFNLDTTSGYYTVLNIISRAFTRQLVSYPASPDFAKSLRLAPDVAAAFRHGRTAASAPTARRTRSASSRASSGTRPRRVR